MDPIDNIVTTATNRLTSYPVMTADLEFIARVLAHVADGSLPELDRNDRARAALLARGMFGVVSA